MFRGSVCGPTGTRWELLRWRRYSGNIQRIDSPEGVEFVSTVLFPNNDLVVTIPLILSLTGSADSPAHPYKFQEDDLRDILPIRYLANGLRFADSE